MNRRLMTQRAGIRARSGEKSLFRRDREYTGGAACESESENTRQEELLTIACFQWRCDMKSPKRQAWLVKTHT